MVTLKEVAQETGVSIKTVSRVINSDENVSDDTRTAVLEAVKRLGYRPNLAARNMRTRRSQVIGFITDEITTTPFAVEIIKGAQDFAWTHNLMLMIANTGGDLSLGETAFDMMLNRQVEGIIYATMYHHMARLPDSAYEVPTVLVNCFSEDQSLPSVVPDEVQGGQDATQVLLQAGHRRIGLVNLGVGIPATVGREEGYRLALAEYRIPFQEELVRYISGPGQEGEGYDLALDLLNLPDPPSALFCANDRIALGAYGAVNSLGLRIPQDIAIVGFDNQESIAQYIRPRLSTMALPHYQMGEWAVRCLLEPASAASHVRQEKLLCPFIKRESV
ncbi:MAG: LacI family DNA-binding transcriptional regulator [Anaerolineae bacterium]|nr:LacI family DNA-binding transcriptional regulator [Anaerolineae bacterium]